MMFCEEVLWNLLPQAKHFLNFFYSGRCKVQEMHANEKGGERRKSQSHKNSKRLFMICTQSHTITKTLALGSQRCTTFISELDFCAMKQEVQDDYFQ